MASKIAPCDVKRLRDVLKLQQSAWDSRHFWMLVNEDGSVTITKQAMGEAKTEQIKIPRRQFGAMVAWYQREQNAAPRPASASGERSR